MLLIQSLNKIRDISIVDIYDYKILFIKENNSEVLLINKLWTVINIIYLIYFDDIYKYERAKSDGESVEENI